jgi:hypothetical protein
MFRLALVAALALTLAPAAARADAAFDAFQSLCMATSAIAKDVKAKAAEQGFVAPPQDVQAKLVLPNITASTSLWKATDNGVLIVVWGEGRSQGIPGISDACVVAASPVRDNPEAALQALLSVGPPRPGPLPLFVYADRSGSRRALKVGDQQAAIEALSARRLRFAAVRNDASFTWISLSSPRGQ